MADDRDYHAEGIIGSCYNMLLPMLHRRLCYRVWACIDGGNIFCTVSSILAAVNNSFDGLLSAYNHNNRDSWLQRHDVEYLSSCMLLVFWPLFEVLFIANTELMIHNSVALVKLGESQWTFGQTLAMLMR